MNVQKFNRNTHGKDYIVGDIHGEFDVVLHALKLVNFDRNRDRLFCTGDTVDRGPASPRAAKFLSQPWVHSVRGNHESDFLEIYSDGEPHPAALEFAMCHNGRQWWRNVPEKDRQVLLNAFRALPIAIEIETDRGTVGIIHGDVPAGLTWPTFLDLLKRDDKNTVQTALWGRSRISYDDDSGVPGVGRVFVGHTPIPTPRRLGNVFYLDTGSVFGILSNDPRIGRLTIADLTCATVTFTNTAVNHIVDARIEAPNPIVPFSAYTTTK